ncbi:hypothetical protein HanHA300_Chr09g0298881 [Helianthus annuus]|nr:hypothetical protein HanHA300_Chr09g0298881 [Helianthus annuus]KAJ0531906.1 hypothetical protein HanIR_Chr09g0390791 [Helianthus annuus]KAJ0540499.1 hypothetical protein HanHA89_Chr09g0317511 [Helianthus annuus]KAJ0705642.1 hypothetical protein HanLR1_Chr09g0297701 [Helianthus annuus]
MKKTILEESVDRKLWFTNRSLRLGADVKQSSRTVYYGSLTVAYGWCYRKTRI